MNLALKSQEPTRVTRTLFVAALALVGFTTLFKADVSVKFPKSAPTRTSSTIQNRALPARPSTYLPVITSKDSAGLTTPVSRDFVFDNRSVCTVPLAYYALVVSAAFAAFGWVLRPSKSPEASSLVMVTTTGAPTPKTGHHIAEQDLVQEALAHFFSDPAAITVTPTTGGVNNVVQYVTTPQGERYILRIYNNGNKSEKVVWEHEILRQVNLQPLSFQVPKPLPAKNGSTHVLLSSGAECCVFHVIPGSLAKTTSPEEVGRATGELCTAMGKVHVDMKGPIAPYWDVFSTHHYIGGRKDVFYNEIATNAKFDVCREAIDYLVGEIRTMEAKLEEFKAMGLPMQIVHGDLHYDNVMVVDDTVAGLLDFEFCAYDYRAMELAVALSKYVGEAEPLPLIEAFVRGYSQHGQLTPTEVSIIPDLINLRIFSNVIYFTSRAMAKEDSLESLTSRAGAYAKRVKWINANRSAIVEVIRRCMPAKDLTVSSA